MDHEAAFSIAGSQSGWHSDPPKTKGVLIGLAAIVAATLAGKLALAFLPRESLPLVYLIAVLGLASYGGFWLGIITSVEAFLAYDFFFVPPLHTLSVAGAEEVLALFVFLAVAGLMGALTGRLREMASRARIRADLLARLVRTASDFAACETPEAVNRLVGVHLSDLSGKPALTLKLIEGRVDPAAVAAMDDADRIAADWAIAYGARVDACFEANGNRHRFMPVQENGEVTMLLGVVVDGDEQDRRALSETADAVMAQAATVRERLQFAAKASAAELEAEREHLRSALLTSLSHDLRTPLAGILGAATSLRELNATLSEAARTDLLAMIEEEVRRLNGFVTNVLTMTRLEGALDLKSEWTDMQDCARMAINHLRTVHPEARMILDETEAAPVVRADHVLMQQVIGNLLDNSIRHGGANVTTVVHVAVVGDCVRVSVTDDGPGIAPALQDRIFEKFFTTASTGAGLGLTICRRIVAACGGSLSVESPVRDGYGTRFIIDLPCRTVVELGQ